MEGRMRKHISPPVTAVLTDLLHAAAQQPALQPHLLMLTASYLERAAAAIARRMATVRARSFTKWIRQHLRQRSGPIRRWSKPRGWTNSQVDTALGPSSASEDICRVQRPSRKDVW
eukprot:7168639-Pyramimonas_sp.AAC.1